MGAFSQHAVVLFALTATLLGGCASIHPKSSYPTDDGLLAEYDPVSQKRFIPPEAFEAARLRPECQPAERDPAGNWGERVDGFQISLRFATNVFIAGDSIVADLYLRNVSSRNLQYVIPVPDKYLRAKVYRDRTMILSRDELRRDGSFDSRVRDLIQQRRASLLFAHTQYKITLDLSEMYDLTIPGRYSIRAGRLVPGIDLRNSRECMSAEVEFTVLSGKTH